MDKQQCPVCGELMRNERCRECFGTGVSFWIDDSTACPVCEGKGYVLRCANDPHVETWVTKTLKQAGVDDE